MRKFYFLILSIFIISEMSAQTPDWQWAVHGGSPLSGNDDDELRDMETDEEGNTYVYSIVNGFAKFDSIQGPDHGGTERALAKYNCDGKLEWVRFIGGKASAFFGGLAIGKDGNIYINGRTEGSGNNFPDWHLHDTIVKTQVPQYFQASFDRAGNRINLFLGNPSVGQTGISLEAGADGNLYALGGGWGGEFHPGFPLDSSLFLLKMDTLMNVHWIKPVVPYSLMSGNGNISTSSLKLESDPSNNLYISGFYRDSLKIGGQTLYTTPGQSNGFLAKYNSAGSFLWVKETKENWSTTIVGIAVSSDAIYIGGGGTNGLVIGRDTLQYTKGIGGPFVAKLDLNGNGIWAKPYYMGGDLVLSEDEQEIWGIGTWWDSTYVGNILVTTTNDAHDPILAQYDTSGNVLFATNISSTGVYQDRGTHITTDPKGNVYVGGTFEGTFMTADTFTSHGGKRDVFLIKYGVEDCEDTTIDGIGHLAENSDDFQMYPNPATSSIYLTFEEQPQLVQVYDFHGRLVAAFDKEQVENSHVELDISTWTQGIYFVSVTGNDGRSVVRKLVKME